jgi:hypothetical protein
MLAAHLRMERGAKSDRSLARLKERIKSKCLKRIKDARRETTSAFRQGNRADGSSLVGASKNARNAPEGDSLGSDLSFQHTHNVQSMKKRAKCIIKEELALAKTEYLQFKHKKSRGGGRGGGWGKGADLSDDSDEEDGSDESDDGNDGDDDDDWAFDECSLAAALLSVEEALELELACLDNALLEEAQAVEEQDADALASQIEALLLDERQLHNRQEGRQPRGQVQNADSSSSSNSSSSSSSSSSSNLPACRVKEDARETLAAKTALAYSYGGIDGSEIGGDGVLCPVCKKHWLVERDRGVICICGEEKKHWEAVMFVYSLF